MFDSKEEGRVIGAGSLIFSTDDEGFKVASEGIGCRIVDDPAFKEVVLRALKADFDEVEECPHCGIHLDGSRFLEAASECFKEARKG